MKERVDRFQTIQAVVVYIENRLNQDICYEDLAQATGFSLPRLREIFKAHTGLSLGRYIKERRLSHGAFFLVSTQETILDISLNLGYSSPDSFTRAFRQHTGLNPMEFRNQKRTVGRRKLATGVHGPFVQNQQKVLASLEETKTNSSSQNSAYIFGVPRVGFAWNEITPFPACLRSVLHVHGYQKQYGHIMVSTGAAFRLRWNPGKWDGGNVDITRTYDNPLKVFERGFQACGCSYKIHQRTLQTQKEEFQTIIKKEIDAGRPLLAMGIIGPPEVCIIAGYRQNGEVLLGWNYFQDEPTFSENASRDASGYFISEKWWDNPCTLAIMTIDEKLRASKINEAEMLSNAYSVLTQEKFQSKNLQPICGGQAAFEAWARDLSHPHFPPQLPLPELMGRLMCHNDAMAMVGEGRAYAALFFENYAHTHTKVSSLAQKIAQLFHEEQNLIQTMAEFLGGFGGGELQAQSLQKSSTRNAIIECIQEAQEKEKLASQFLLQLIEVISE
ncbi:MAG: AraC family transcriptional regulator [Spirochaetales bacterium]|nr:AraC family transcriptional regulator [Spirochaetales bacterium]